MGVMGWELRPPKPPARLVLREPKYDEGDSGGVTSLGLRRDCCWGGGGGACGSGAGGGIKVPSKLSAKPPGLNDKWAEGLRKGCREGMLARKY